MKSPDLFLYIFLMLFLLGFKSQSRIKIDLDKIAQIESSNCINKINKDETAIGCYQITQSVLTDYNIFYTTNYTLYDMTNDNLSFGVAEWYLNTRIPEMLEAYKKPVTLENILICYNAGIKYVVNDLKSPQETIEYIKKYKNLIRENK